MNFTTSLINVGLMIAMAVPGFLLKKSKKLPENATKVMSTVLLYACQPFLTVASFTRAQFDSSILLNMGIAVILSFALIVIAYLVCRLVFVYKKEDAVKRVYMTCGYMNNCAFMGIPLIKLLFPDNNSAIIYCAVFVAVYNILCWTLSVFTISGNKNYISIKKAFINPPTLALIVALPLFFCKVTMPTPVVTTVNFFADMTTPLSMVIMGIRLGGISFKKLFSGAGVYISASLKLVIVPLASLGIMMLLKLAFNLDATLIATLFILMAMPTAATAILFSEVFDGNAEEATKVMLLSSLMSILTIPLMMLFVQLI